MDSPICDHCGRDDISSVAGAGRCIGCRQATYCSEECQRQNWAVGHNVDCPRFTSKLSKGNILIALGIVLDVVISPFTITDAAFTAAFLGSEGVKYSVTMFSRGAKTIVGKWYETMMKNIATISMLNAVLTIDSGSNFVKQEARENYWRNVDNVIAIWSRKAEKNAEKNVDHPGRIQVQGSIARDIVLLIRRSAEQLVKPRNVNVNFEAEQRDLANILIKGVTLGRRAVVFGRQEVLENAVKQYADAQFDYYRSLRESLVEEKREEVRESGNVFTKEEWDEMSKKAKSRAKKVRETAAQVGRYLDSM